MATADRVKLSELQTPADVRFQIVLAQAVNPDVDPKWIEAVFILNHHFKNQMVLLFKVDAKYEVVYGKDLSELSERGDDLANELNPVMHLVHNPEIRTQPKTTSTEALFHAWRSRHAA